jgi:hypothetical protein
MDKLVRDPTLRVVGVIGPDARYPAERCAVRAVDGRDAEHQAIVRGVIERRRERVWAHKVRGDR